MADIIEPKILKGFRDFLPPAEIKRRDLTERIEASFRSYGFVPIDTPALEYSEILLGKSGGETEKQIYRFKDNGDRDVALRFDLTVPFARFIACHRKDLVMPFKRYHIAKVWRGENPQRGRYREFTQCDFDILGSDSVAADFEILLMMRNTLMAVGAEDIRIRINHRGLFNHFLTVLEVRERSPMILRSVDKLAKIGEAATLELLTEITGEEKARRILDFTGARGSFEEILRTMTEASGGKSPESERLEGLRRFMIDTGTTESFILDPSITRGLDYYTGIVYETFLAELPDIGSICSGGRYDNLAGLYSRERISGVGSSIGIDRLIAALEALGRSAESPSYARLAVGCLKEDRGGAYQVLGEKLRKGGIPCEVFLDEDKLTKQFMAAENKGFTWFLIPGDDPLGDPLTLRNLKLRENREGLSIEELITILTTS